jgi:hypothetical protein
MPEDTPEVFDPAEDCPWRSPREILARHGFTPLPPGELDDRQLPGRLWELLYAAAARRFFFCFTNHLDDRTLYQLLWDEWLDEPTADIPLSAETNTHTIVSEFNAGGMTHEEIYLRYYADEDAVDRWRSSDPDCIVPPHEDPPHDRDRFFPIPPNPHGAQGGWVPGGDDDDDSPEEPESDPLGLNAVDREIAASQTEAASSEEPPLEISDPALAARLHASEPENWTPPAQKLAAENIPMLPPVELTDETLTPILWELLHNLSLRGFYVLNTDHLSDRELYAELWERGLRDPACLPGRNQNGGWFHDILGSWGEEEVQLWLRYHATDEERAKHLQDWPADILPAKEKPIANRDWRLPKGPF